MITTDFFNEQLQYNEAVHDTFIEGKIYNEQEEESNN